MSLILSLDTSTSICSAAIHKEGKLLYLAEVHQPQAHGEKLAPLIKQLTSLAGVSVSALAAVAITSGPGSYTGLRIGTSTAKGLCFSLNIPLIACDVLTVLAHQIRKTGVEGLLCPMIDARRMEVYCALYEQDLSMVEGIEARIIDERTFESWLKERKVLFFGDGASKCKGVLNSENAIFLDGIYPSVASLGEMAYQKFTETRFEDVVHFEPYYLKDFMIKKPTKIDTVLNK